jgi:2-(1,2-epoxy-1,2-dihydrophenyl)acetyl-CoA isomerase
VLLGEPLGAAGALALGLVNRVVPAAELDATALDVAERLARGPTQAIGLAKALLNRSLDADFGAALHDEAIAQEVVLNSGDAAESFSAAREGRRPTFSGW